MASRFSSLFVRAGAPSLLRQFGEQIKYFPGGQTRNARSILAIIERNVAIPSETGDQVAQALMVRVLDSTTSGIGATEINDGRDVVELAIVAGGTAERRQITRLADDSNGMVRFMVR